MSIKEEVQSQLLQRCLDKMLDFDMLNSLPPGDELTDLRELMLLICAETGTDPTSLPGQGVDNHYGDL